MLEQLINALTYTGNAIAQRRSEVADGGTWEGDQLKTQADQLAHELLESRLADILSVSVISEENSSSQTHNRPDQYWLIDPIDGTRSLVDGFPGWVTQAALVVHGAPVLSGAFAPDLGLLYTAEQGKGAYCNQVRLKVNHSSNENLVLVDNYPEPRGVAQKIYQELPCTDYLESGSISLKICRVAEGKADLFVKDVPVRDWDVAAPMLILLEAGGVMSDGHGSDFALSGDFEKQGLLAARDKTLNERSLPYVNIG